MPSGDWFCHACKGRKDGRVCSPRARVGQMGLVSLSSSPPAACQHPSDGLLIHRTTNNNTADESMSKPITAAHRTGGDGCSAASSERRLCWGSERHSAPTKSKGETGASVAPPSSNHECVVVDRQHQRIDSCA